MPEPTEIEATVGSEFSIELASNPTTGFSWVVEPTPGHLELLEREYLHSSHLIGAGGQETFRFRALRAGEAEIVCRYRRPWEDRPVDERRFRVRIRP